MKVLIACEESQTVCKAFRNKGHEAYSCDILSCSGGHPEWHIQHDVLDVLKGGCFPLGNLDFIKDEVIIQKWDMEIGFPPCTYLTVSANKWYKEQPERKSGTLVGAARNEARNEATKFFMALYNSGISKVAIENPIGIMSTVFRKPNQVLQPWMFGHGETKATCLWLKGLPRLNATNIVEGREQRLHLLPPTEDRAMLRSKTFQGIADAMANQWG